MKTSTIYDPKSIEPKWQKHWLKQRIYQPDLKTAKRPYYNLMMFPYPSAEGLHVGNMYAFTGADVHGRFKRMQGYDVFEPIGLDGFGIHSENYAIRVGRHPIEHAKVSEKHFYEQLHMIGNGFAWDQKLETYDPEYYKWTQWLFVQMYKHGLAYRKKAMVNWCPSCKTVLSDEQVEGGVCERCKTSTTRKETEQWFFRITNYANRLLDNLEKINWPKKIKVAQRNWIGKTLGLNIDFRIGGTNDTITIWTKFWETVFGTTFVVLAPEHGIVASLLNSKLKTQNSKLEAIKVYVQSALKKTEQQRKAGTEKTGVFTGLYAINPVNQEKVPIWIADYVMMDVGTGAVMGVPAHDERDFEFAKKHNLGVVQVVSYADSEIDKKVKNLEMANEDEGKLVNSGQFDGLDAWGEGKQKMANWMIEKGFARWQTTYHLRDWLISRQRYWGPPIPMVFCAECAQRARSEKHEARSQETDTSSLEPQASSQHGWFPVPEDQLPVLLPYVKDFQPIGEGKAPLEKAPKEWLTTTCPNCGGKATRSTEVSDTFLDSSWYFLRYPSIKTQNSKLKTQNYNSKLKAETELLWNLEITRKWLPVNAYIGGAEHAVLHLLYARFVWMALRDWGYLPSSGTKHEARSMKQSEMFNNLAPRASRLAPSGWDEPFPFLFSHGLIIKDGAKMSKSRGNVVTPDEYISRYGADCLRMYLMFLGPYDQGGDFRDSGIAGMYRFLERIWKAFEKSGMKAKGQRMKEETASELKKKLHRTIKKLTEDLPKFKFNTSIAFLMEFMNALERKSKRQEARGKRQEQRINDHELHASSHVLQALSRDDAVSFLKLLAPFAPHMSDELYHRMNSQDERSIHELPWPEYDENLARSETIAIPIQVNGKTRAVIDIDAGDASDETTVTRIARSHDAIVKHLTGKTVERTIFVPSKTLNFVIQKS